MATLPSDAKVLYRKLGMKSKFGFGKHADLTVHDVLVGLSPQWKGVEYLYWCYYNCSNISFIDSILDEIGISPEMRIPKPGTAPERFEEWRVEKYKNAWHEKFDGKTEEQIALHYMRKGKKRLNAAYAKCVRKEIIRRPKAGEMAWKNQGHR